MNSPRTATVEGQSFAAVSQMPSHPATSSDSDDIESPQFAQQPCHKTPQIKHTIVVGMVCIAIGFACGTMIASSKQGNVEVGISDVISEFEPGKHSSHCLKHADNIAPENYLAVSTTHLKLVNVTREEGWAPWQLAVSGNAAFLSDCESQRGLECRKNAKNPEWKEFDGGVWAMFIDPEKDLGVHEKYKDEELIETRFQVILTNELEEPSLMHFHGLTPPSNLDGMPWISSNPIQPGHTVFYDFTLYHRGFYWMHSHLGHHAGSGLYAPIVVQDHPKYLKKIGNPRDVLMLIYDAHWRAPCAYARHLYPEECPVGGFDSWDQYTFNVNGHSLEGGNRNVSTVIVKPGERVRVRVLDVGTMAAYRIHLNGELEGQIIATDGRHVRDTSKTRNITSFPLAGANRFDLLLRIPLKAGCFPIKAVRAQPTNLTKNESQRGVLILKTDGSSCPDETYSPKGNAPAVTAEEIKDFLMKFQAKSPLKDLHKAADVHHIVNLTGKFKNDTGEWIPDFSLNDRRLRLWPNIVWCHVPQCAKDDEECLIEESGTVENTVLDMKFCQSKIFVISNVRCDEYKCKENQTQANGYRETDDGRCLSAHQTDDWEKVHVRQCDHFKLRPQQFTYNDHALEVCHGDRVWITYVDGGTKEMHPLHLHGTHQQLIKVNGEEVSGPLMDTWLLIPGGNITVAFDALNPGEWLLHCHIEHHLMNGMGTTVRYVMNHRCQERLDLKAQPKWRHAEPVPKAEWPQDWKTLMNRTPMKASILTSVEYDPAKP